MTNYAELKRLAEAAKLELADIANVVIEDGDLSHHELFQSLASPDVVLGLIKSLEHTTMAAEAEAKEVDERNAVIDKLRTQNQALVEAIKGFHTWAYGQRKQQSKGGHASFDYMELREQMDIAEAALAQAEGGV